MPFVKSNHKYQDQFVSIQKTKMDLIDDSYRSKGNYSVNLPSQSRGHSNEFENTQKKSLK